MHKTAGMLPWASLRWLFVEERRTLEGNIIIQLCALILVWHVHVVNHWCAGVAVCG